jgi:hypothetical protein
MTHCELIITNMKFAMNSNKTATIREMKWKEYVGLPGRLLPDY